LRTLNIISCQPLYDIHAGTWLAGYADYHVWGVIMGMCMFLG